MTACQFVEQRDQRPTDEASIGTVRDGVLDGPLAENGQKGEAEKCREFNGNNPVPAQWLILVLALTQKHPTAQAKDDDDEIAARAQTSL